MKTESESKKTDTRTEATIDLVFDGKNVEGVWYHPKLEPVICSLCGKGCKEVKCVNVNPYCG